MYARVLRGRFLICAGTATRMRLLIRARNARIVPYLQPRKFHGIYRPQRMTRKWGKAMADKLTDWLVHYGQDELSHLVAEVVESTNAIDHAFARQEAAIEALSKGWQAVEAKRMAAYELSEAAE
jgi:hypothetical protein